MNWKLGLIAGGLLLTGCDNRSDAEISVGMQSHIRQRCLQDNAGLFSERIEPSLYCDCIVDGLTEGKSRAEFVQMEENPASYLQPPEPLVRECRASSQMR